MLSEASQFTNDLVGCLQAVVLARLIPRDVIAESGEERKRKCGMRSSECGVRSAECGMRNAECGVRSAEGGLRNAEQVWLIPTQAE